jgi:hypothetical protein
MRQDLARVFDSFCGKKNKEKLVKRKNYISPSYPHLFTQTIKDRQTKLNNTLFTMSLLAFCPFLGYRFEYLDNLWYNSCRL